MTDPRDETDGAEPPPEGPSADAESADDPAGRSGADPDRIGGPSPSDGESGDATETETDVDERAALAEAVETPGEPRTLHPRVRVKWAVGPLFGALLTALLAAGGTWAFAYPAFPADRRTSAVGVGVGVFLTLAVYGAVKAVYLYRSWRYVVRDESLYLTRGVFTLVQTVVPYVRVQHIDTRRSAFDRVLGLSTLVVYTAGSRGADVTIPGLTPETAEDLQSRLERLAIASEDEDAV